MTAPLDLLEGPTTLTLISDYFPQLNELIINGLIVNEGWNGFMDSRLHLFCKSLHRQRGLNVVATVGDVDNEDYGYDCTWRDHYIYFASSQSLDLVKKVFNDATMHLETVGRVFLTVRPGLGWSLPQLVSMVASQVDESDPLWLSTDVSLSDMDMETLLAALKRRVSSFMIWRGGEQEEEEVNVNEVGAVSNILSMLADPDARGNLTRVSLSKVNIRHAHVLTSFHRAFSWLQSLAWKHGGLEGKRW